MRSLSLADGGLGSLALALARMSQPLPPCQQQEGKEE